MCSGGGEGKETGCGGGTKRDFKHFAFLRKSDDKFSVPGSGPNTY